MLEVYTLLLVITVALGLPTTRYFRPMLCKLKESIKQNLVDFPFKAELRIQIRVPLKAWGGGPVDLWLFSLYSKNFRQPIPENSWPLITFYCGCSFEKKNSKSLVFPSAEHFWDTQYKNILIFVALIKKIFLQTLVGIIFRYH